MHNLRRYQELRPAAAQPLSAPDQSSSDLLDHSLAPLQQRRRAGVASACLACRKKKIRCNGAYPACTTCEQTGRECVYEAGESSSSSGSGDSSGDGLVEAIRLLNSMPPQQALQMLGSLQGEGAASQIISSLRIGAYHNTRRQESSTADLGGTTPTAHRPSLAVELEIRHPFAYPPLNPIDLGHADSQLRFLLEASQEKTQQDGGAQPMSLANTPMSVISDGSRDGVDESTLKGGVFNQHPELTPRPPPASPSSRILNKLRALRINSWTRVPISDELASKVIALYLDTDHSLMGSFEPDLFVHALISHQGSQCSALLVNALLYWACQIYSAIDDEAESLVDGFGDEAYRLWQEDGASVSITNLLATQYMGLGYQSRGKDHAVLQFLAEAVRIGTAMGFFGLKHKPAQQRMGRLSAEQTKIASYAAWGIFNWTMLMAVFYHQPGVEYPKIPPVLPLPDMKAPKVVPGGMDPIRSSQARQFRALFPTLCEFWSIMNEVAVVYYSNDSKPSVSHLTIQFAEYKYKELLAWADNLPPVLSRNGFKSHLVVTFHVWFHAAILDIFRPFVQSAGDGHYKLRTFSSGISSPTIVRDASLEQLKRLIVIYRFNYRPSTYSIMWHTALLYVANAMLQDTEKKDWLVYFLLCLYGYEGLDKSFRVAEAMGRGLLSMAMRNGYLSGDHSRRVMADFQKRKLWDHVKGEIRATCMLDLNLAMSQPFAATAERESAEGN